MNSLKSHDKFRTCSSVYAVQYFPLVKVPVAAASRTRKRRICSFTGTGHEFPAAIHSITSRVRRMILLALPVSNIPHRWWWRGVISLHDHLPLFHLSQNPNPIQFPRSLCGWIWDGSIDPFSSSFHPENGKDR